MWEGEEEITYGYTKPNNLHIPTRQGTAIWVVYCHLLLMEISMTKTNYSLDIINCGGQEQTLLLGGTHTGNNF